MVVVGVDAHKRTHTLVAIDDAGRKVAEKTVAATPEGHLEAVEWAQRWPERQFALEDCRHVTRRLERTCSSLGSPLSGCRRGLMAGARKGGREQGNPTRSTPWRLPGLRSVSRTCPWSVLDGEAGQVRLIVDHRDELVRERTRIQSRLRWHLHELFPGLEIAPKSLRRQHVMSEVEKRLEGVPERSPGSPESSWSAVASSPSGPTSSSVRSPCSSGVWHPRCSPCPGCGVLSAAKIVGESAGASRFRSKAAFARWNGTAPIPVWSGNNARHRLTRGGNRQINAALHRIAVTQLTRCRRHWA